MNENLHSDETKYWEKIYREASMNTIIRCEDAAKQLISLISLLITTYFGIISFSKTLQQPVLLRQTLLFILLPLPFLLASLILAILAIVPRSYIIKKIREDYETISQTKYSFLRWGYTLLVLSMFTLIVVLVVYLLFVPPSPA